MSTIQIKRIPFSRGDERRCKLSMFKLSEHYYNNPFVMHAEDRILSSLGLTNDAQVRSALIISRMQLLEARQNSNEKLAKKILFSSEFKPIDYSLSPICFAGINTAITKFIGLKGLKGKKILGLAPNWGPYMHFLKNQYGAKVFGVEMNGTAVKYAKKEGGLDFLQGDASQMSFRDNSFDAVISRNFLDYNYLHLFAPDDIDKTARFIESVVSETHRVLKPGGLYFSQPDYEVSPSLPAVRQFSRFNVFCIPGTDPVNILQK